MSAPTPPRPSGGGMSLYANLLDPVGDSSSSPAIASKDQSESKDNNAPPVKKVIDPALRFQPMLRRPQVNRPTAKPKPSFPKVPPAAPSIPSAPAAAATAPAATQPPQRNTLADWAATEEDEYLYSASNEKRQRGGRRKKKKKADERQQTDWDEIYDPARPTNVEEYLRSDERIREVREWKDILYAHRRKSRSQDRYSDEEEDEPDRRGMGMNNQFAPPTSFNFAPPPTSPQGAANVPEDATGDDAYARRMALSQQPPPPPPQDANPLPPPPNSTDTATISRAPVRYSSPPPPPTDPDAMDLDSSPSETEEDVDYSSINVGGSLSQKTRGKAFAAKLMSKYGWTAGTGLGASSSGITAALSVQPLKRKKKSDAEGGGFRDPAAAQGRIIAPKSLATPFHPQQQENNTGQKISRVVVLRDMLLNMPDLAAEVEAGLGQEIGEECGERYGRVERLFIDQSERLGGNKRVYIQFVEEVSALRAVRALEGRIFNGNTIRAGFYDADKFEEGVYEE
ncbi:hypothetical protein QBC36DRAFT_321468 [Triangularia setosa]|uniref:G-patch domain-containing protein n=1 Tax=Triangularia setosa TaxID=2587417 RepID=A0AAN6WE02_9PEZI|nr:hypothetical protein QBC36DRAFT_321468 [Podospora setosa]